MLISYTGNKKIVDFLSICEKSKKIHRKLKWKSRINLKEGLANTCQWYLNNMGFFTSVSKKLYDKRLGLK